MTRPDVQSREQRPLWERPELRRAAGDTLRPGGLALTDRAAEFAGLGPGWRVLDVGAGLGATADHLRLRFGATAVGLDRSAEQLGLRPIAVPLVRGDAMALPFADGSFKMLFCECVLSLLAHKEQALAEFARVLLPGGWLALSDLYLHPGAAVQSPRPTGSCAGGALAEGRLRQLLYGAGFGIRHFEDHTRLLKELAARLIFTGAATGCQRGPGMGYALFIAQHPGESP